jgi:hypothetical protein
LKKTISLALELDTQSGEHRFVSGGDSIPGALKEFNRLVQLNASKPWGADGRNAEDKGKLALEAGRFFKRHIGPLMAEMVDMTAAEMARAAGIKLEAADYADPAGNLGTLSGTMVMQKALPLFSYEYPELAAMFTDFSSEPGALEQAADTRVISQPAVQKFDATVDATGRPKGWSTVSNAVAVDRQLTLTDYIGVPIVFGQNTLSSTGRDLFGEFASAAIKSIAGYYTGMVTLLITPANYNAYGAVTAPDANGVVQVPVAYTTYGKSLTDWSMTDLDKLGAIFTQNKVPRSQRGILMNCAYYAKLRSDPRLEFFFAAAKANPLLTDGTLPEGLSGFMPYEAPYLPASVPFFPFHKAGIILKSRLPQRFDQALSNTMIPGRITTVTDPDTKLSVALVEYVNLLSNFAESRPEVILGVGVGDNRGGLCGGSQ